MLATSICAALMGLGWQVGTLISTFAMAGDLLSSFVKRRLHLASSSMAIGLDHIPESLFPLLAIRSLLPLSTLDIVAGVTIFVVGADPVAPPVQVEPSRRAPLTAIVSSVGGGGAVLLTGLRPRTMLLADRGYDADWIRALAICQGAWANIPPKSNRKDPICFSPFLYRERNLVERFFSKIKHCRRVATRYDKLAANYLAFVKLACIRLWLRVYEFTALG
jgi:transposase